ELGVLVGSVLDGASAVINPFGAVVAQNKRAMALMWEEIDRFPAWARESIRRLVPESARLEALDGATLSAEEDRWVLKSDYGCGGAEVRAGADCTDADWREALSHALPTRWIAQRRFVPRLVEEGASVNYGVYLVGGEAAGYLSRIQVGATDARALTAATLVKR